VSQAGPTTGGGEPRDSAPKGEPRRPAGRSEPRRTVVFGPELRSRPTRPERPLVTEIAEQTEVGEVVLRSLLSAQLRLSLLVLLLFGSVLGGLPLLFIASPHLARLKLAGIPVQWLVVGFGVFPLLWAIARLYVHFAEKNEGEFVELTHRS
jgi:hypothetical protein